MKQNQKLNQKQNYLIYKPKSSLKVLTIQNFTWACSGIILGIIVNETIKIINLFIINNNIIQILIHIFIASIVLAFIAEKIYYFGWSWQNTIPGLFFISVFFGTQFELFIKLSNLLP